MNWEEARSGCLDKWYQIQQTAEGMVEEGRRDPAALLTKIAESCPFCEVAEEHKEQGKEPLSGLKGMTKCHFCEAYAAYGGCQEPVHHLNRAIADEDWDQVRFRILEIIGLLEEIDLPQKDV